MVQCMQALRADATSCGRIQLDDNTNSSSSGGDGQKSTSSTSKSKSKSSCPSKATVSTEPPASYSGIIPNALEVYLNDPVVDWLKGASNKTAKDKERANNSSNNSKNTSGDKGSALTAEVSCRFCVAYFYSLFILLPKVVCR